MDRSEILNDSVETMQQVLDARQSTIWTSMPGIIKSVNLSKMTCEVQLSIRGEQEQTDGTIKQVDIYPLVDVPIVFPSAGGFTITFPIAAGNEVLVIIASRCIDAWFQSGGVQQAMEARMHDLSDGFAIPGPKSLPHVISSISSSKLQMRNNDGTVYLGIGSKFAMKNATTDLKTILSDLESLLNTFMGTLAGFAGGAAPVTQAMLQTPAITAQTALAAVLAEISALLETS